MTKLLSVLLLLLPLAAQAGQGRQTLTVEADYSYRATRAWVEKYSDAIEESTGATITWKDGPNIRVSRQTRLGEIEFAIRQTAAGDTFSAKMFARVKGTIESYECVLTLKPLAARRTEVTVVMSARDSVANNVEVNIDLRKSLRGMRTLLTRYLSKDRANPERP